MDESKVNVGSPQLNDIPSICEPLHEEILAMHEVITELKLWDVLATMEMKNYLDFLQNPIIHKIGNHPKVEAGGHTGASMMYCVQMMRFIAKNGWEAFVTQSVKGSD